MEHEPDRPVTPGAHDPPTGEPDAGRTAGTPGAGPGPGTPEPGGTADEPPADPAGTADDTGLPPEEEPTTTGTLFIMILFLMALAGMWGIMYLTLLNR